MSTLSTESIASTSSEQSSSTTSSVDSAQPLYSPLFALHRKLSVAQPGSPNVPASSTDSPNLSYRLRVKLAELRPLVGENENYENAVKACRSGFGNPTLVIGALNALAASLKEEGKGDMAVALFRDSLDLKRNSLGNDPTVAISICTLASCLQDQGRVQEAVEQYLEAIALCDSSVGHKHVQTATVISAYAGCLMVQGDFALATASYTEALNIRRAVLGDDNPTVAASINQLGQQALSIYTKVLGPEHPTTVAARRESVVQHQALQ
jgi:tetratricopeptide (TPR) repeat protein